MLDSHSAILSFFTLRKSHKICSLKDQYFSRVRNIHARTRYADKQDRTSKCNHFHQIWESRKWNAKFPATGLSDRACLPAVLIIPICASCCTYCHFSVCALPQMKARSGKAPGNSCRREEMGVLTPGQGGTDLSLWHAGLLIRCDMNKCRAQFRNHCSALHQRQPARQYVMYNSVSDSPFISTLQLQTFCFQL